MKFNIDQNVVHNWHVAQVKNSRAFTDEMRVDLAAAHARHHNEGTSAAQEARDFNEKYNLVPVTVR